MGDEIFFVGGELGLDGLDFFGQNPGVYAVARCRWRGPGG